MSATVGVNGSLCSYLVLFLIFLSACTQARPEVVVTASPPTATQKVSEPSETVPVKKLTPLLPSTPIPPTTLNLATLSPTPTPRPAFQMCSPLAWETIPELWEIVTNPFNFLGLGREDGHHGVDFAHYRRKGHLDMLGEEIASVLPGRTAASIQDRLPYGNMVMIETMYSDLPEGLVSSLNMPSSDSLYLLYAHMLSAPAVSLGDPVICGEVLGQVGASGMGIVNEHLHLEARLGPPGIVFRSMAYYDTMANPDEMAAYVRWRTSGEFQPFDPLILFAAFLGWSGHTVPTLAPTSVLNP